MFVIIRQCITATPLTRFDKPINLEWRDKFGYVDSSLAKPVRTSLLQLYFNNNYL